MVVTLEKLAFIINGWYLARHIFVGKSVVLHLDKGSDLKMHYWCEREERKAHYLAGLEPMTSLLWGMCSTTVLHNRCPAIILFLNFIPDRRRLHAGLRIVHDGAAHPLPGRGPIHPRARSLQDPGLRWHPRRVQRVLAARRLQPQGRTIINPSLYNTSLSMF